MLPRTQNRPPVGLRVLCITPTTTRTPPHATHSSQYFGEGSVAVLLGTAAGLLLQALRGVAPREWIEDLLIFNPGDFFTYGLYGVVLYCSTHMSITTIQVSAPAHHLFRWPQCQEEALLPQPAHHQWLWHSRHLCVLYHHCTAPLCSVPSLTIPLTGRVSGTGEHFRCDRLCCCVAGMWEGRCAYVVRTETETFLLCVYGCACIHNFMHRCLIKIKSHCCSVWCLVRVSSMMQCLSCCSRLYRCVCVGHSSVVVTCVYTCHVGNNNSMECMHWSVLASTTLHQPQSHTHPSTNKQTNKQTGTWPTSSIECMDSVGYFWSFCVSTSSVHHTGCCDRVAHLSSIATPAL